MNNPKPPLLEADLTYKLRGIFIEISKEYGYQFKEQFYHNLCLEKFKQNNVDCLSKPKIPLRLANSDKVLDYYIPDFLIESKVIVEIKATNQLQNNHSNQLVRYLTLSGYTVGLLVNFGAPVVQIIRRVNSGCYKHVNVE